MENMKRRYNNMTINEIPVFDLGKNMRTTYNYEEVDEILRTVPFDKIPVAVNAYKNEFYNDLSRTGSMPVGFVTGYDPENHTFNITVLEKFSGRIEEYETFMIYPRVRVIKGKVVGILGFDLCTEAYYANLFNA